MGLAFGVAILLFGSAAVTQPSSACLAPAASESTGQVALEIRYSDDPPRRVSVESAGGPDRCLSHIAERQHFAGSYPLGALILPATVVAEWPNAPLTAVALQARYRPTPIAFRLPRPQDGPCRPRAVAQLQNSAGSRDAALAAAYQARHWYRSASGCPASMKGAVARAWFDRSFEATTREPALVLDMEAATALLRERPGDRSYVEGMIRNARRALVGNVNDLQNNLAQTSNLQAAIGVNMAMREAISTDAELAQIYAQEGITVMSLERDFTYLNALSAQRAPGPTAVEAATIATEDNLMNAVTLAIGEGYQDGRPM